MSQVSIHKHSKRLKESQKGFGDNMAMIYIFIACCVVSIILGTLGWIKSTKDARLQSEWERSITRNPGHRGPPGYTIVQ